MRKLRAHIQGGTGRDHFSIWCREESGANLFRLELTKEQLASVLMSQGVDVDLAFADEEQLAKIECGDNMNDAATSRKRVWMEEKNQALREKLREEVERWSQRLLTTSQERDEALAAFRACDEQRAENQRAAETAERRVAELERELAETKAALAEWILSHESLDRKSNDALNDARAEAERLREESMRWQMKYTLRRQGYSEEIDRLRAEAERLRKQVDLQDEHADRIHADRVRLADEKRAMRPVVDAVRNWRTRWVVGLVHSEEEAALVRAYDTYLASIGQPEPVADSAESTKPCGCPGGPVEHIMDCEAIRHDVHEQEKAVAVREALERAAERVASKVTRTHELGSVLVCGHGIPINNDDEMPKTERAIQRELRAAILGES